MTVFNRKTTTLQCLNSLKKLKLPKEYSYEVFLTMMDALMGLQKR